MPSLADIIFILAIGAGAIIGVAAIVAGLAYAFAAWLTDSYTDTGDGE